MKKKLLILCLITLLFTGCDSITKNDLISGSKKIIEADSYTASFEIIVDGHSTADGILKTNLRDKLTDINMNVNYENVNGILDFKNSVYHPEGSVLELPFNEIDSKYINLKDYSTLIDLNLFNDVNNSQIKKENDYYKLKIEDDQFIYFDYLLKDILDSNLKINSMELSVKLNNKNVEIIKVYVDAILNGSKSKIDIVVKYTSINNTVVTLPVKDM